MSVLPFNVLSLTFISAFVFELDVEDLQDGPGGADLGSAGHGLQDLSPPDVRNRALNRRCKS